MNEKSKTVRYKLAKGKGLKIPGVALMITNANVNDPRVIKIITHAEKNGRRYIGPGLAIVEA